jgi:hypothetical protein
VADGSKNAIRYIGFKNLTDGAAEVIIDGIRGFYSNQYIDSPNISNYKINKEFVYRHSAKPEKETFEVILYPTDDAYTASTAPNANTGSRAVMGVRGNGASAEWNMFLKWDLSQIPEGVTIDEATMYLYQYKSTGGNVSSATMHACDADWNENTVTWNNQPSTTGSNLHTWNMTPTGYINDGGDIYTTFSNWYTGAANNYGITIRTTQNATSEFYTKDFGASHVWPYIKVKYTVTTDPNDVIVAGATNYLYANHEPAIRYEVNLADLSEVMVNTWHEETISLGDTVKVYDSDLNLNVYVRVKKITRNVLEPTDVKIELANRAYTIADLEAKRARQLSYAMPCQDNPNIIDASAVQIGYLGSDVQV